MEPTMGARFIVEFPKCGRISTIVCATGDAYAEACGRRLGSARGGTLAAMPLQDKINPRKQAREIVAHRLSRCGQAMVRRVRRTAAVRTCAKQLTFQLLERANAH